MTAYCISVFPTNDDDKWYKRFRVSRFEPQIGEPVVVLHRSTRQFKLRAALSTSSYVPHYCMAISQNDYTKYALQEHQACTVGVMGKVGEIVNLCTHMRNEQNRPNESLTSKNFQTRCALARNLTLAICISAQVLL